MADVGGEATAETAAVVADGPQVSAGLDETRFDLQAIPVSPGPDETRFDLQAIPASPGSDETRFDLRAIPVSPEPDETRFDLRAIPASPGPDETRFDLPVILPSPGPDETRFDLPAIPASPGPDETRPDRVAEPKTVPVVPVASQNGGVRLPPAPDATTVAASIQPLETERTLQTDSTTGEQFLEASTARISKVGGRPYLGPGNLGPRFDDTRPDLVDTIHTPILRIARDNGTTAPNRPASAATVPPPAAEIGTDSTQLAETDDDFPLKVEADLADPPSSADVTAARPEATPPRTALSPQAEQARPPETIAPEAPAPEPSAPQTLAPQAPGPQSPAPQARSRLLSRRQSRTDRSNGPSAGAPAPSVADSSAAASSPAASSPAVADAAGASAGAAGASAAGSKKSRGGYFGLAPSVRPDVITDAETIMLPALKKNQTKSGSKSGPATNGGHAQQSSGPMPALAFAGPPEAATQIMPVLEAPLLVAPAPVPAKHKGKGKRRRADLPERYVTDRHTKRMSRLILFVILCIQACLSLRLHNTAFEDEAQYLYAGHMELEHMLHGTALQGDYTSFFSGSPVLYPVAAAALDQVGGLALARALSLVEMLAVTTMAYSIARYLFNERVGLYTAALYSVAEAAIFLGNFATYDATSLCLLAFAAWIMVYSCRCRWPVFLLAAPVAALAVAVKYAGLLFVPTIAVLPIVAAWPDRRRRVVLNTAGFLIGVAVVLYLALRLGGHSYMAAIESTTTNRAQGTTSDLTILKEFAEWGGVVFVVAVIGTIAYVRKVETEPNEKIAAPGGPLRRAVLGIVLTGSALLAPVYQAHLHTDVSFLKHVGFGLFFAAPMAGFGLARIIGDYVRWPHLGVGVWSLGLVLGMMQSGSLYQAWPNTTPFIQTFDGYLKPNAKYLVEVPEVPIYYLMGKPDAQPDQFTSTYFITYYNTKGQALSGAAGYAAAIGAGTFQVVAYNGDVTQSVDDAIQQALATSKQYYLASVVPLSDGQGPVNYYIWVKGKRPNGLGLMPFEGQRGRYIMAG